MITATATLARLLVRGFVGWRAAGARTRVLPSETVDAMAGDLATSEAVVAARRALFFSTDV
jgi:hypothetical protein